MKLTIEEYTLLVGFAVPIKITKYEQIYDLVNRIRESKGLASYRNTDNDYLMAYAILGDHIRKFLFNEDYHFNKENYILFLMAHKYKSIYGPLLKRYFNRIPDKKKAASKAIYALRRFGRHMGKKTIWPEMENFSLNDVSEKPVVEVDFTDCFLGY